MIMLAVTNIALKDQDDIDTVGKIEANKAAPLLEHKVESFMPMCHNRGLFTTEKEMFIFLYRQVCPPFLSYPLYTFCGSGQHRNVTSPILPPYLYFLGLLWFPCV